MASVHGLDARDAVLMPAPLAHVSRAAERRARPRRRRRCGAQLDATRWDPGRALDTHRARAHHVHDRPADVLRRAHGRPRRSPRERVAVAAPRLERRRRASRRVRRRGDRTRSGAVVKRTYGSTEAPTIATSSAARLRRRGRATDGRAIGAAELRVTDPDDRPRAPRRRRRRAVAPRARAVRRLHRRRRRPRAAIAPAAGSAPATSPPSTPTVGSRSSAASRTSSSAAARTSRRPRSSACSKPIPTSARPSRSAIPTTGSASACARSS